MGCGRNTNQPEFYNLTVITESIENRISDTKTLTTKKKKELNVKISTE